MISSPPSPLLALTDAHVRFHVRHKSLDIIAALWEEWSGEIASKEEEKGEKWASHLSHSLFLFLHNQVCRADDAFCLWFSLRFDVAGNMIDLVVQQWILETISKRKFILQVVIRTFQIWGIEVQTTLFSRAEARESEMINKIHLNSERHQFGVLLVWFCGLVVRQTKSFFWRRFACWVTWLGRCFVASYLSERGFSLHCTASQFSEWLLLKTSSPNVLSELKSNCIRKHPVPSPYLKPWLPPSGQAEVS